jgi:hypothetical protein
MKTIHLGKSTYQVAENWTELTPDQLLHLIVCPRLKDSRTTENEAAACQIWLTISPKKWRKTVLAPFQWGALVKQFEWLFTTRPTGKPIRSFFHEGLNYHLPADDFADTDAIDLAYANMAYLEFSRPDETDRSALDRLIATLCRPMRTDWRGFQKSGAWDGDLREEFNEQLMLERARSLATLELNAKVLMLDYFERMNETFLREFGEIFGGTGEPRYQDGRGWIMLLKNVAKSGTFGTFDQVCHTPATLLFAAVLDDVLQQQEEQDELDKQRTSHDAHY